MNAHGGVGALVISLDFELRWGVHDHCPPGSAYERNLMGAREAIPRMLELFAEFGVAATWATVGFLFARSSEERERFRPAVLPAYLQKELSPYAEVTGPGEEADPLHFAPSLIRKILDTPRQEIGTHTFSHFFCNEPGQDAAAFRADLEAACAIAAQWDIRLRSIVFPRNQVNPEYHSILKEHGIHAFRGNPESWMWRFSDREQSAGAAKRLGRLADAYLDVGGGAPVAWQEVATNDGLANVRASRVVRPFDPRFARLEPLRLRRIRSHLRRAALRNRIAHLWWHPHNFGLHPDESLQFLRGILEEFTRCRKEHGMQSLTMGEVAAVTLGGGTRRATSADPSGAPARQPPSRSARSFGAFRQPLPRRS